MNARICSTLSMLSNSIFLSPLDRRVSKDGYEGMIQIVGGTTGKNNWSISQLGVKSILFRKEDSIIQVFIHISTWLFRRACLALILNERSKLRYPDLIWKHCSASLVSHLRTALPGSSQQKSPFERFAVVPIEQSHKSTFEVGIAE